MDPPDQLDLPALAFRDLLVPRDPPGPPGLLGLLDPRDLPGLPRLPRCPLRLLPRPQLLFLLSKPRLRFLPLRSPTRTSRRPSNTDIVVVGAGAAGLFAALAAAQSGAKVIQIEKSDTFQGRGGDNTAIDSKLQKKLGIQLDKDKIVRELMHWGGGRLDETLVYLWANNCGKVMDLIIDMMDAEGLPTYLVIPDRTDKEAAVIDKWPMPTGFPAGYSYLNENPVEYPTCHRPGSPATGQATWLKVVEKNVLKAGQKSATRPRPSSWFARLTMAGSLR